jgi:hypothetical protein
MITEFNEIDIILSILNSLFVKLNNSSNSHFKSGSTLFKYIKS